MTPAPAGGWLLVLALIVPAAGMVMSMALGGRHCRAVDRGIARQLPLRRGGPGAVPKLDFTR